MDFLTKKQKVNEGEVPQYFVEHSHDAIIDPEEFELVQAEIERRKGLGKEYSGSPFSQRKSSAPAVEGSSARKCGIAQANTGELSGSAITNFPSLPETKSVKRHIFMRTR